MRTQREGGPLRAEERGRRHRTCPHLILDFEPSQLRANQFLSCRNCPVTPPLGYFVMVALANILSPSFYFPDSKPLLGGTGEASLAATVGASRWGSQLSHESVQGAGCHVGGPLVGNGGDRLERASSAVCWSSFLLRGPGRGSLAPPSDSASH